MLGLAALLVFGWSRIRGPKPSTGDMPELDVHELALLSGGAQLDDSDAIASMTSRLASAGLLHGRRRPAARVRR